MALNPTGIHVCGSNIIKHYQMDSQWLVHYDIFEQIIDLKPTKYVDALNTWYTNQAAELSTPYWRKKLMTSRVMNICPNCVFTNS